MLGAHFYYNDLFVHGRLELVVFAGGGALATLTLGSKREARWCSSGASVATYFAGKCASKSHPEAAAAQSRVASQAPRARCHLEVRLENEIIMIQLGERGASLS